MMYMFCGCMPNSPTVKIKTVFVSSLTICPNWSAIKALSYPLFTPPSYPLLIRIIVCTKVEFWCETFASLSRIKHAMSWPFVCSDFHSTGEQRSLETFKKCSSLWKTHHSHVVCWDLSVGCFLLSAGSALLILLLLCGFGLVQEISQIIGDR